jgi:disulfide bond formation protein DsbB
VNFFGFILCCSAFAFALIYLQGVLGLDPCPLCTAVRILVILQALFFLLAFLHNPRQLGQRLYAGLGLIIALAGTGTSLRHIWLQSLPKDQVPECGPGLEYILDAFPFMDALAMILSGSGECADTQWSLLGLSIPQQTLGFYILLLCLLVIQLRKQQKRTFFN